MEEENKKELNFIFDTSSIIEGENTQNASTIKNDSQKEMKGPKMSTSRSVTPENDKENNLIKSQSFLDTSSNISVLNMSKTRLYSRYSSVGKGEYIVNKGF